MGKKKHAISPPHREPNGRVARASLAMLKQAEREQRLRNTALVRGQIHRRWLGDRADHPWAESPFGQFCLGNRLHEDLFSAGQIYTGLVRSWRLAKGLPCPFGHNGDGTGDVGDQDPAKLWRRVEDANKAMKRASYAGYWQVHHMCGHRRDFDENESVRKTIDALFALAVHFGARPALLHPFAA